MMLIRRLFAAVAALAVQACAPKPSTPSGPAPATSPDAAPAAVACPDNTDTPQIIGYTISARYPAFARNRAAVLPSCFVEAVGRNAKAYSDSTVTATLEMSDAILASRPDDVPNLAGRISLLTRARRYREVPASFDRLVRIDTSRATLANYRLALAAALRGNDTTARLRYLTAAARKFPNAQIIVADYNIQRQVPRLHALIDSSHQVLRLDPRRIERYATLASVYGNLDVPDSAIHYTRRALQAGVSRNEVAPSLQSLIGVVMRKAQLLDAPDVWESTLPIARDIDRTLSTDASKHLIALAAVQVASEHVRVAREVVGTAAQAASGSTPIATAEQRTNACRGVSAVPALITEARDAMNQGGSRFSPETVPAILNGMSIVGGEYTEVVPRCPR